MEEKDAVQLLLASAVQPLTTETEILARDIVKVIVLRLLWYFFPHLSKALYCFPLAVVQAGSFISRIGTLRKYLTLFEQNSAQLLGRLPSQSYDRYAWSVYTTWDISFKCLSPPAAKFLQICSFLHHEGISEAIFSTAAAYEYFSLGPTEEQIEEPCKFLNSFLTQAGSWDDLYFTDITIEIKGYSLINQDPNTNLLSIHPLVHDWARETNVDTTSTRECAAALLAMSTISNWDNKVFLISLLPHINAVLQGDNRLAHQFPYPYQRVFYDSGHFDCARDLCVMLLENRKHILGSEHSETLHIMAELSVTYWAMGSVTEAEVLQVAVLEQRKEILGSEHPDTLDAMSNLAVTYHSLGKFSDAEELQVAALAKRKQILGSEHPDILEAMSNLATTYWDLDKFTAAEELGVALLEKRKQLLWTEHPETLTSMRNLALTYKHLGKFTEAEHLLLTVVEIRAPTLGPEHKDTIRARGDLT
jgi:tetratricopeptide (TPR) repeat protein